METIALSALYIFCLRIVDVSLYVMRLAMVVNGRKALAWIFAFCQAAVYVVAIQAVLSDLDSPLHILGYAAGFATGLVLGILVENRIGLGFVNLRIISPTLGADISEQLRGEGFAVTEISGRGKDGNVSILDLSIFRRDRERVVSKVAQIDSQAFITSESIRSVRKGFWGK
jgi:uncharacterized protein YebE (UPF0316 family)